jgi:hypothetical protein
MIDPRIATAAEYIGSLTAGERDRAERQLRLLTANATDVTPGVLGQRVDIAVLVRDGVPPPDFLATPTLGERLFYAGSAWIVSGHKKSGKTWALVATALDQVRAGRPVVYLDFENGARMFARRSIALGAGPDELAEHLHYVPFPQGLRLDRLRDQLEQIAAELPGAFVVVDSLRGLLSAIDPGGRQPLNVNDPLSIEGALQPFNAAAKDSGVTIGIIDHAKKGATDSDEYSTANAAAKEQVVDAVYFWTKVEPYNEEIAGTVKIAARADREGLLDFERFYRVGGQGAGRPFTFERTDSGDVGDAGRIRAEIRQYLMDAAGPVTKTEIRRNVAGNSERKDRALEALVSDTREPVFADAQGYHGRLVYVWDESREQASGMDL